MVDGQVLVVTRTKNRPLLLRRALESVLNQTYPQWIQVVVNDGGDPGPVDALATMYGDRFAGRLQVIHHAASKGMEAASNAALAARPDAQYVVIHDDDDDWAPDFLEKTTAYLRANPAYRGVICKTQLITETIDGDAVTETSAQPFMPQLRSVSLARILSTNLFPPISFLFERAALDAVGGYCEELNVLGDWEFNIRFLEKFDIGVVPEILANWRHRTDGAVGAYQNSFVGDEHIKKFAILRNHRLRQDIAAQKPGLGFLMNLQDSIADIPDMHREIERLLVENAARMEQINILTKELTAANAFADHLKQHQAALQESYKTQEKAAADDRTVLINRIAELTDDYNKMHGKLAGVVLSRQEILNSTAWRVTKPLRNAMTLVKLVRQHIQNQGGAVVFTRKTIKKMIALLRNPRLTLRKIKDIVAIVRAKGVDGIQEEIDKRNDFQAQYAVWRSKYDQIAPEDVTAIRAHIDRMARKPVFSVVMPTYNTPERWLRRVIESVQEQIYPHWEFCIADDCSPQPHVRHVLEEYAARDPRIKLVFRETNGHISAASNSAIEIAAGDYVALLDHDDEITPHALYMVAAELEAHPDAMLIYSDEDKINEDGECFDPHFKSDWNPDLMRSHNMVCHLGVYETKLLKEIGGFRLGYEGSQDYDLTLRFSEKVRSEQIRHIPHILYHWRTIPGSTALGADQKSYPYEAARRCIRDHLKNIGHERTEVGPAFAHTLNRITYLLPESPPKVTIIIPTKDKVELLQACVDSILELSTYPNYEVVILDNQSRLPETKIWLKRIVEDPRVRVELYDKPYNFSDMNNQAAANADGDVLLFLNNDTKVITPGWIEEMVGHALRPEVAAVGARLLFPNNGVQHAGIGLHPQLIAFNLFGGLHPGAPGYFGKSLLLQNVSAVTAACLAVRKSVFDEVGGFDAENLAIAYNDVDLCLKFREKGYLNTYTPYAELYHYESATLGVPTDPVRRAQFERERDYAVQRWRPVLERDPYFSPNLDPHCGDFIPSYVPRVGKPWRITPQNSDA